MADTDAWPAWVVPALVAPIVLAVLALAVLVCVLRRRRRPNQPSNGVRPASLASSTPSSHHPLIPDDEEAALRAPPSPSRARSSRSICVSSPISTPPGTVRGGGGHGPSSLGAGASAARLSMTSLPGTVVLAAAARASAASLRSASSSGALRAGSAVPRSTPPVAASSASSDASDQDDNDDNDRTPRPVPAADPATVLLATTPSPSPAALSGLSFPAAAVGSFRSTLSSLASRSWRGRQGSSTSMVAATPSDVVASGGGKPATHGILRMLRRASKDAVRRSDGGEPIPVPDRDDEDDDVEVEDNDEATPPVGHGVRDHPTASATLTPAPAKPWPIPTSFTKAVTGSRVSLPDPTLDHPADSSIPSALPSSGHVRHGSAESGAATLCATPRVPIPLARTPSNLAASDPSITWPRPFSAPTPPVGWPHANDSPVPAGVRALDLPTPRAFLPGTPGASAAAAAVHFYSAGVFPISLTTLNSTTASSMATLHHRRTATADSADGFLLSGSSPSVAWADAAGTPRSRTIASVSAPASPSGLPAWAMTPRHVPRTTPRTPGMRSGRSTRSRRAATPSMHAVPPVPAVPSTATTPAASPSDATPAPTPLAPPANLLDWPPTVPSSPSLPVPLPVVPMTSMSPAPSPLREFARSRASSAGTLFHTQTTPPGSPYVASGATAATPTAGRSAARGGNWSPVAPSPLAGWRGARSVRGRPMSAVVPARVVGDEGVVVGGDPDAMLPQGGEEMVLVPPVPDAVMVQVTLATESGTTVMAESHADEV
ncbi:hypothetical protein AMAG_15034 [Allomyces macrogynus ATCC 38327]|uniref:Uncharacterized protein n=1 Tax=Allomyces macrogynus (strain ATCC 38327) TaxID=578462 RepID=A0A0L0T5M5_ALLM3|nr:hypothetical protein AMAG_15034 [Allomyces macrogynus ATCC 38327]|eukprot:KNE70045.1 hypothetical protein AMAG_15034 [Allomyces macrogynus ATCC 38327]